MNDNPQLAPGAPGIPPRWTSSAKSGVGTARNLASRVWFTISHGILDEVYFPRVDRACTRDLGFIVTDGRALFSEEKRHTRHQVTPLARGVPAYRVENTCEQGRYRVEKEILTDPRRDVVLQRVRFVPLQSALDDYHLYALLAPHLGNRGYGNTAWVGDYKGTPMLFAERDGYALSLASTAPWLNRSAGFVGVSDGWQDLHVHKVMTWIYDRAENGNVALTGEIDLHAVNGAFDVALGFGLNAAEAAQRARASLFDGFDAARERYLVEWQTWQDALIPLEQETRGRADASHDASSRTISTPRVMRDDASELYRVSTAVLRTHEAKRFPGGIIASLSIPWGFAKGDDDLGGYHLVWPRDLVQAAGGLLAAGARDDARRVLRFLYASQEADGHWAQNMWLDGTPYWNGMQMDETALPILLVDLARREGALDDADVARLYPMVRRAASFLVRSGPVTQEDRWEEDAGYSPFTLAAEIAALLAAADRADEQREPNVATFLRETADAWNANIEKWMYVTRTELAQRVGVEGYYVRITPPETAGASFVPIKNRPPGESRVPASLLVSPDALALVRFGLRAPDDPRILNTVRVVDALLKVETPCGPACHRYNGDGYGEHADGAPFDGVGIGRAWTLLTGERAHYELAAGHPQEAERLRRAMANFANEGGMIPEQIWDAPDIPARELYLGRPSGSATPLVWAHAEYVKLLRSLRDGRVFDVPPQTVQRYLVEQRSSPYALWAFNHKRSTMRMGKTLRIQLQAPALVHWSADDWKTIQDTPTRGTGLGVHVADLPTADLARGARVVFTFFWQQANKWEGMDFTVQVG